MERYSLLPQYTFQDYEMWDGNWEIISGTAYAMTPLPNFKHQNISGNIHSQLKNLLSNCKKCTPLLPVDWKVADDTILQPDNSVICFPVDENAKYLTQSPSLIFEILSPSTASKDKVIKFQIYQTEKVKYYVIVNPKNNSSDVFELKDDEYDKIITAKNEKVLFDLLECKINFDFSGIW